MADECDKARHYQQQEIERAIMRRRAVPQITPNGECHWCLAPVGPRQLFCDMDCSADFDKDWNRRQR